jgi:diguanylate cyclase (GGDEF)-like protein/PAS domain S-box-containing protein
MPRFFSGAVPPALREAVLMEQSADLPPIMLVFGIGILLSYPLVYLALAMLPGLATRSALLAVIMLVVPVLMVVSWRQLKARKTVTPEKAKQYIRIITVLLFAIGMCWGVVLVEPVLYLTWPQRLLMAGCDIVCLAMPIMLSPIITAAALWLPIVVGALCGTIFTPNNDPASLPGMILFAIMSVFSTLFQNHRQMERIIAQLQAARSAAALEEKNDLISLLLNDFEESSSDWLWETDAQLRFTNTSVRFAEVCGLTPEEMNGKFLQDLIPAHSVEGEAGTAMLPPSYYMPRRLSFRDVLLPVVIKGQERFWSMSGRPVFDKAGSFTGYHCVGSDITDKQQQQQQIEYLVTHDALTGLPNRTKFNTLLEAACAEADPFALLYLDLDQFKAVNETEGLAAGDVVLRRVAERLRSFMPNEGHLARLAADEFAIIWPGADNDALEELTATIIAGLSAPYQLPGKDVHVGVSIGIVLAPRDGAEPGELLKHVDLAVQRAKAERRGGWLFYDPDMDERQHARRTMRADLQAALPRGEFLIHFQPVIDLSAKRIAGAEALLRWQHPVRGMMPPAEFIPLAEESGLIIPIGAWVLQQACKVAASWPAHVSIAVNLSPVQFRDPALVESVMQALDQAGLEASRLELEITESTLLDTDSATLDALTRLHHYGVRIALDDFGTGYSSLSYLRRFPFNKIKIDRSFVRDLSADSDDSSIVLAILGLAERLKMQVTAEGVETTAQAELLTHYGCPLAQGYLYSRPVPAAQIATLMAAEGALVG